MENPVSEFTKSWTSVGLLSIAVVGGIALYATIGRNADGYAKLLSAGTSGLTNLLKTAMG